MNPDPRLFLSARRPNGQDDRDPAVAGALAQCASEPALSAWAETERATDAALVLKIRAVQPPAGLRERILAGAQIERPSWRAWFERRAWRTFRNSELVAAAAIVLLLGVALMFRQMPGESSQSTWQEAAALEVAAIEAAGSTDPLDHVVSDLPEIRRWLAEQTCPSPASLPPPVQRLAIYGCAKRLWRGQPLSIVCFAFERGREVHLVTIDRKNLPASPPEARPVFAKIGGFMTASWSDGNVAMMLLGKVEPAELEKLFPPAGTARRPESLLPLAMRGPR